MALDRCALPGASLEAYLARLRQMPRLDAAAEHALAARVRQGDREAAWALVGHHLRWVARLAAAVAPRSPTGEPVWSLADALQTGTLACWAAVWRFDPAQARFATYVAWWIRQALTRDRGRLDAPWTLPLGERRALRQLQRAEQQLVTHLHRPPTVTELAAALGWPPTAVQSRQALAALLWIDLDGPLADDLPDTPVESVVPDPTADVWARLEHAARQAALQAALALLPPRWAQVLIWRYGLFGTPPHTLAQIARRWGLSPERVRQLEQQALQRLRTDPRAQALLAEWRPSPSR